MVDISSQRYARWERWFLAGLCLLSLGIRIFYSIQTSHDPFFNHLRLDELFHKNWAESIAAGNITGDEVYFRAPFYAYWLGAVFAIFGNNFIVARIIQHLLGTCTVLLVYILARRLFGTRVAVIASLLMSTYAFLIYLEDQFLFESVLILEIVLFFILLSRTIERPGFLRWFCLGLLFGIICITRPVFLPFFFLVLFLQSWSYSKSLGWKKAATMIGAMVLGTFIVITPITLRNYLVGQDVVLIASQGGLNFYLGNNPSADGYSSKLPGDPGLSWEEKDLAYAELQGIGHVAKPSEASHYWYMQALNFITSQPYTFISLVGKKFALFWNAFEIPNNGNFYSSLNKSTILYYLPTGFWLVGPFALYGIWISRKERKLWIFHLTVIGYTGITILFFVCDRFRAPILPFLCIFAALAILELLKNLKRPHFVPVLKVVVPLGVLFLLVNVNFYGFTKDTTGIDLFYKGNIALDGGNVNAAIKNYRSSSNTGKSFRDLHLNWGVAEWEKRNPTDALNQFRQELYAFPRSYEALSNIAHLYYLGGQSDSASFYAQQAIRIKPYASTPYIDLAFIQMDNHQVDQGKKILTICLNKHPNDSLYVQSLLAGMDLLQGKAEQAKNEYQLILQEILPSRQPSYQPEYQFSERFKYGASLENFRAKVFYSLGHAALLLAQPDSALFFFTRATEEWPNFSDAWFDLATVFFDLRRLSEADSAFRRGFSLNTSNATAWYNYGLLMEERNMLQDARRSFIKALDLQPGLETAQKELHNLQGR